MQTTDQSKAAVPAALQEPAGDPIAEAARELGVGEAQLRAHVARVEARQAAAADPAPGPLLEAFLPSTLTAAGFTLRPAVYSDFLILRAIKSPILDELRELSKPADERQAITYTDVDYWELLYIWTRPIGELHTALAGQASSLSRNGAGAAERREHFRAAALAATADRLPISVIAELPAMVTALSTNFLRAFSTQVGYRPPPAQDGSVFPVPPEAQTMASAGGSTQ
jgi:hypothetical protein